MERIFFVPCKTGTGKNFMHFMEIAPPNIQLRLTVNVIGGQTGFSVPLWHRMISPAGVIRNVVSEQLINSFIARSCFL